MSKQAHNENEDTAKYWRALEAVLDPEVPVLSVLDLGLVRDLKLSDGGALEVALTPTYTGCPATKLIEDNVREALLMAGASKVTIKTQLSPPWTTDWMSDEGKDKLRAYGISPPLHSSTSKASIMGIDPTIACPQCGSEKTVKVSEFGSTACKALYKCESCLEPFDYFKCI
ncbi:MAG: phenylacetate-CoA oxygenase subunit PaaJ [Sphingomonadales bacterium]|nr:phenylacetate-CoA oxygenase subunit PaaJ [Sphingomonadales bacterium]